MKLSDFRILKIDFSVNRDFNEKKKKDPIKPEFSINHEFIKKDKTLVVIIGVRKISGNVPYLFEIHGAGLFEFDKLPTQKVLKQFAKINCPAIVFPYVRETIADLTRRAGFSPLHISPVNFIEMAKQIDKAKTREVTKQNKK
jgi:preprotein translocase subunit SecB